MPVAGIVVAMNTNSVPLSRVAPPGGIKAAFGRAYSQFAADLKRWFLPHLLASAGIFMLAAQVSAWVFFSAWASSFKWVCIILMLAVYGAFAWGYSLVTSGLFALRLACQHWDGFFEELLDQVQQQAAVQVSNADTGLSKPQARAVVRGSVREVFAARPDSQKGISRVFLFVTAGVTMAVLRAVLFSKIAKWSGRTIQISKLFAGKATLAGAVLLNLHFFTTVLLGLCYAAGVLVLAVNIYFVFLLK